MLGSQSIVGLSLLIGRFPSEGNHKYSYYVSVVGLAVLDSFDECSSLLDQGRKLVSGGVDSIKAGQSVSASGFINNKFNFPPCEGILVGG